MELLAVPLQMFSAKKSFNKIAAFNVNAFRRKLSPEFELVANLLKKDGLFYLFYQLPHEPDNETLEEWKANAIENGFELRKIFFKRLKPSSATCLLLRTKH